MQIQYNVLTSVNDTLFCISQTVVLFVIISHTLNFSLFVLILTDSARIGSNRLANINIMANDNANGILQLSCAAVNVSEGVIAPFINVTRVSGAFGQVSTKTS